jgi:hypothetical protein
MRERWPELRFEMKLGYLEFVDICIDGGERRIEGRSLQLTARPLAPSTAWVVLSLVVLYLLVSADFSLFQSEHETMFVALVPTGRCSVGDDALCARG